MRKLFSGLGDAFRSLEWESIRGSTATASRIGSTRDKDGRF